MIPFQVVYSELMNSDPGQDPKLGIVSPSAGKPKAVAEALETVYPGIHFRSPPALKRRDFCLAHDPKYVDDVFVMRRPNGFATFSDSVNRSLPYTNGAMYEACRIARPNRPACALVSGFHHAGYADASGGCFCTFNGLMIAALKAISDKCGWISVAIIDCDMHYGNGTEDIIEKLGCQDQVAHYTLGRLFMGRGQGDKYLSYLDRVMALEINEFAPDLIIYQSGADVHVNDPLGGVLTEDQMMERDRRVFTIAKDLNVPLAWCLAGGYQVDPDGSIPTVVRLHMNTFRVAEEVYGQRARLD